MVILRLKLTRVSNVKLYICTCTRLFACKNFKVILLWQSLERPWIRLVFTSNTTSILRFLYNIEFWWRNQAFAELCRLEYTSKNLHLINLFSYWKNNQSYIIFLFFYLVFCEQIHENGETIIAITIEYLFYGNNPITIVEQQIFWLIFRI